MANQVLELVVAKITEDADNVSEDILDGLPDMERYKYLTGYRRGLMSAIDIIKDMEKKIEEE